MKGHLVFDPETKFEIADAETKKVLEGKWNLTDETPWEFALCDAIVDLYNIKCYTDGDEKVALRECCELIAEFRSKGLKDSANHLMTEEAMWGLYKASDVEDFDEVYNRVYEILDIICP